MRRPRFAALALTGAVVVLTACGGPKHPKAAAPAPVAPTPATAPSASASPAAPVGPPSPLSGRPTKTGQPVFAVKIDNTASARPQAGLNSADEVYVEQVEGGLTRLLAVFSSRIPASVGPVRSVRSDNLDLLAQFGPSVGFAYSGGQPAVLSVVRGSGVVDLSYDRFSADYVRTPGRPAPYNLFTDPQTLLDGRPGISVAKSMGFVFRASKPPTSGVGTTVTVTYPAATLVFTYQPASHAYTITQDGNLMKGADGKPELAANVVVQRIQQVSTGYRDVRGSFTPANLTVGQGDATVLRDGHAIDSTWKRPDRTAGTRLLTKRTGVDVSLRPGTTWVLLLPTAGGMSVT